MFSSTLEVVDLKNSITFNLKKTIFSRSKSSRSEISNSFYQYQDYIFQPNAQYLE